MTPTDAKTCTKCGEVKSLHEYGRDKQKIDGLTSHCKDCKRVARAKYYAANREDVLAQAVEYNARPEIKARRRDYQVKYYTDNREAILASIAERQARPEVKARRAERWAEYSAQPEVRAHREKYYADNPHVGWESQYRVRAKKFGFAPVIESFTRAELIAKYGDECAHCGGPFEELDHAIVPVAHGGEHSLDNCRPSCTPCNRKGGGVRRLAQTDIGETA